MANPVVHGPPSPWCGGCATQQTRLPISPQHVSACQLCIVWMSTSLVGPVDVTHTLSVCLMSTSRTGRNGGRPAEGYGE
jgi:hypothetical protein